MYTKVIEVGEFVVKGFGLKGTLAQIPGTWERFNLKIGREGIVAEEFFGVCASMENGKIHYIAGIKSHHAEKISDTKEVVVPGGKYIVAAVDGGISKIPTTFNKMMATPHFHMREGYAIERYTRFENELIIELWLPIE